jgi:hypothetical protein
LRRLLIALLIVCAGVVVRATIPLPTDNFTGSNGDDLDVYNAAWLKRAAPLEIQSNAVKHEGGANQGIHIWDETVDNFNDNQEASWTCTAGLAASEYCGVGVRGQGNFGTSTLNGYYVICNDSACHIQEFVNSVAANVCGGSEGSIANTNKIKISVETSGANAVLKAYKDTGGGWVQMGSTCTDTTTVHTGGNPWVYIYFTTTSVTADDFNADNVAAAGGSTTRSLGLLGVGQ